MTSNEDIRKEQDVPVSEPELSECEIHAAESEVPTDSEQDAADIPESETEQDSETEQSEPVRKIYKLPSAAGQTITVFGIQMRQYFKGKTVLMFVAMALLIPVIVYGEGFFFLPTSPDSISGLLAALPIMMAIIPSILAGRLLSSEFRNKTAFMMFPLPVSRSSYYFGKFLAALTISIGIFSLAYGLAIVTGLSLGIESFPSDFLGSYIICIGGVFAITATAHGLGAMMKRGSAAANITLTFLIPFLIILVTFALMAYVPDMLTEEIQNNMRLLPQFSGFQALSVMDSGHASLIPLVDMFMTTDLSPLHYLGVSAVWGVLFLLMGLRKTNRKEL